MATGTCVKELVLALKTGFALSTCPEVDSKRATQKHSGLKNWCTSHVWAPPLIRQLAGVLQRDWLQPLQISKLLLASDLPRTSRRLWHKACAGVEPAALRELALQLEVVRATYPRTAVPSLALAVLR